MRSKMLLLPAVMIGAIALIGVVSMNSEEPFVGVWPVRGGGRISSPYGWRTNPKRDANVPGKRQFHQGLDIAADVGTELVAPESGQVTRIDRLHEVNGNAVWITAPSGRIWALMHLSSVSVAKGAIVAAGERIGEVGKTGRTTGYHVHVQLYENGATIDPLSRLGGSSPPALV